MDVLRDDDRSILFSSHNTVDVERISDRITFIDRGRLVDSSDKEDFLERWRRIQLQLPAGVDAAGSAARRQPRRSTASSSRSPPTSYSEDLLALLGVARTRRAAHEPRGDLRRECHASPGGARPMNMLTRKLIAKELYVNRWLIAGGAGRGRRLVADRRRGQDAVSTSACSPGSRPSSLLGVMLAMYGIMNERKEHSLQFVLSLPLSHRRLRARQDARPARSAFSCRGRAELRRRRAGAGRCRRTCPTACCPTPCCCASSCWPTSRSCCAARCTPSPRRMIGAVIIVTNMGVTLFMFMVGAAARPQKHMWAPAPVWNSTFWTVLGVELASLAIAFTLPYLVAARRRDFI